ncbi:MAG: response regulator, partial [Planctomycetota bacterium]
KAGGPLTTFVDKDVARELFGTIKGGGSWSGEVEMLSRSGRVIPVEVRGDAVKDEGGNIIGLIGIHTEITERKLVEELRIRMESKIQHMQRLESLGALAGGIARDFNNLLMNVLGNANLALRDLPKDSNASQLVQEIEAAGRKAAELSRQMLAYSGKGRFVLEKINMSNLIRAMSQLIEASAGREIMMRYDLADELPEIVADSSQMRQVVMGLIANAAESYIEEVGFVTIKTGAMNCDRNYFTETYLDEGQKPGRYVFVEVSDTGRGMYEQTIEMMFDPFFTTKEKGRGLGLAAVLGIVRGHDGAIKVDTTPGKGTTIRVLFPAIEKPSHGESGKVAKEAAWSAEGTVLVAEEEESIRLLTERMLHTLGFKTISTGVGSEVLEIFRENAGEIKAVLLDMGVPGLNFEYVLAEMQGLRGDLAVVLTSGYDRTDTVTRLTGKGRIEFIQKPYTVEDLTQTLRSLLEKS